MERNQRVAVLRPYVNSRNWVEGGYRQFGRLGWDWDRAVYSRVTRDRLYRQRRAEGFVERSVHMLARLPFS